MKTIRKIHKLTNYKQLISNQIYKKRLKKTIKEELQNLKNYYTWKYKKLLANYKIISSK